MNFKCSGEGFNICSQQFLRSYWRCIYGFKSQKVASFLASNPKKLIFFMDCNPKKLLFLWISIPKSCIFSVDDWKRFFGKCLTDNPPPMSLRSSKAMLFLPSKGGTQKIFDFLSRVYRAKYGQCSIMNSNYSVRAKVDRFPLWRGAGGRTTVTRPKKTYKSTPPCHPHNLLRRAKRLVWRRVGR